MLAPRIRFVVLCVCVLSAAAAAWALVRTTPSVALSVRGYTVKSWSDDIAFRMGSRDYVVAAIEFTNATRRPVTYWSRYEARFVDYRVLNQTALGWKEAMSGFRCVTGMERQTLLPGQSVTFDATVDRDKPCRVAVNYLNDQKPSRLWQRLPNWLSQRLPWGRMWHTVSTESIDVRKMAGLNLSADKPLPPAPDGVPLIRAAAATGEANAQFRLAGIYWTGSAVEKDATQAVRWYEASARQGHAEAAYNLGVIHEHGLSGTPNQTNAIEWYRKASTLGHTGAKERLEFLVPR